MYQLWEKNLADSVAIYGRGRKLFKPPTYWMSFKYSRGLRFGAKNVCFVQCLLVLLQCALCLFLKFSVHHQICQRIAPRTHQCILHVCTNNPHAFTLFRRALCRICLRPNQPLQDGIRLNQGCKNFPKIQEPAQKSRLQYSDMKQVQGLFMLQQC